MVAIVLRALYILTRSSVKQLYEVGSTVVIFVEVKKLRHRAKGLRTGKWPNQVLNPGNLTSEPTCLTTLVGI